MIRGWYTGASGMNAQQYRLDTISNNLANVDTAGFKKDVTVTKSFSELLLRRKDFDGVYENPFGSADAAPIIGKLGVGVETNENFTDFSEGSLRLTNTSTDLALHGKGFFAIQTPDGERYTRNGNFMIGKEGILQTKDGYPFIQNYMETSNVNVVNEMVRMIEVNRAYEANQKTIQSQDSMMNTLWNRVAAVHR